MNVISLIGRLTSDVELKQTQSGLSVCSFTVAVDRPKVKDTTDFIPCVAWRNTAEFVTKYFSKGNRIALSGVLTSRKYQDQNGANRTAFEVVVDNVEFVESKQNPIDIKKELEFEELPDDKDLPF